MANFEARTASNDPLVTDHKKAQAICDKYGGMENNPRIEERGVWKDGKYANTGEYRLAIFDHEWFVLYPFYKEEDDHALGEVDWDDDATDRFLEEIQPYLAEDLVVHSIGAEKLRFPLSAYSWIVPKGEGKIVEVGIPWDTEGYERMKKGISNGKSN